MTIGKEQMVKRVLSAKDYASDGLLAMYDSIENVNFGEHDPATSVWVDLTRNGHDMQLVDGTYAWRDDKLESVITQRGVAQSSGTAYFPRLSYGNGSYTVEAVCEVMSWPTTEGSVYGLDQSDMFWRSPTGSEGCIYVRVYNKRLTYYQAMFQANWARGNGYDMGSSTTFSDSVFFANPGENLKLVRNGELVAISPTQSFAGQTWISHEQYNLTILTQTYAQFALKCLRIYDGDLPLEKKVANWLVDKERFGI